MFTEDITAIVVDPGSLSIRAGYSGEDTPRLVMPSQVGVREEIKVPDQSQLLKDEDGNIINAEQNKMIEENKSDDKFKNYYVGESNLKIRRDNMEVVSSYMNGEVKDWDAFEKLLLDVYENQIRVQPSEYCLLISESSLHNQRQREKICQLAFESLKVPNFFIVKSGVLSCFSSGRSTALVLDTGAYSTYAVPVHDGYVLQKSVRKFDIGGEFLTEKILNNLQKEQNTRVYPRYCLQFAKEGPKKIDKYLEFPDTHSSYEKFCQLEIARDIKEQICRVDDRGLTFGEMQLERAGYELPDGNFVEFDTARSKYSEFFFAPYETLQQQQENEISQDLLGFRGMHHMVLESINYCDIDIKRQLFNNIILTGGNSLLSGFSSRLQTKLNEISPPNSKIKMIAYPATTERKFSSWIGGSILASLGSFQSLWIGKQEYQDNGEYIVEKKCP
ncbi:actin (macronuclear) [Tetrahymena thermophila SB210]|uniref:Actin n=1 Tax=Tetrahymena thermophila (strain SB210) TaxID=312017 RepID=Q22WQ4_TETTS|nr:actin [Tetrahymena thermophila SB210]EAR89738.2 actin [Tetrahymena thermophila SB210]|eukprot:XP_001009983.2 actin [Tetrahymena thermophila SB210]